MKPLRLLLLFLILASSGYAQTGPGTLRPPPTTTLLSAVTTDTNSSPLSVRDFGAVNLDVAISGGTVIVTVKARINSAATFRAIGGYNDADGSTVSTITASGSYTFTTAGKEDIEVFTTSTSGATTTVIVRPIPSVGKAVRSGGGGISGTGTTGQLAKWTSSTALGNATAGTDYLAPTGSGAGLSGVAKGTGTTNTIPKWSNTSGTLTDSNFVWLASANEFEVQEPSNPNGAVFNLTLTKAAGLANDRIGEFHFYANNSSNTKTQMAAMYADLQDPTSGAEYARLNFNVTRNGTITPLLYLDGNANEFTLNPGSATAAFNFRLAGATKFYVDNTNGAQVRSLMGTAALGYNNVRLGLNVAYPTVQLDDNTNSVRWAWDTGGSSGAMRLVSNASTVAAALSTGGNLTTTGTTQATAFGVGASPGASGTVTYSGGSLFDGSTANVIQQRNSTNPQAFYVYNTYTNASNYERFGLLWNGNTATLFADKAGTGQTRNISIQGYGRVDLVPGNSAGIEVSTAVANFYLPIIFNTDNSVDIGASGATRPRSLYLGTNLTIGSNLFVPKTITAAGTTGAQTINKISGSVNFAAAATSLVVTNSLADANSIINLTVACNDTTMKSVSYVPASGSFTIYSNAAATAECRVDFRISN